jgi:hypothetical protein
MLQPDFSAVIIEMCRDPSGTAAEAGIDEPRRFGDPRLQAEEAADARRDLQGPYLR